MAEEPLTLPHAVVPRGQVAGDDPGIAPFGQGAELQPPSINRLRKMFDEARDLTNAARDEQQLDQDYYDGPAQLKAEVREVLKARGQPPIFDNRIAPAIDGILGVIEAGKSDPRGYPRNPQDEASADVCTKVLRYIADAASWQAVKMDALEDYHKQGVCAVIIEYDGRDIRPVQIRWEEFFYDPKSRRNDFKDAKYLGIAKWMYADELRALYPERYAELGDPISGSMSGIESTWDDRPDNSKPWVDRRRNRLMVVELYYREAGEWMRCVYCAAGWLEFGESPYIDARTNETLCPIEALSFKVDRNNSRYGPIRNMRPMQDEVNARRSRGLHLLNSRQLQQSDTNAPPVDADTARAEASRADGILPPGWTLVATNDMAAGNLQMLAEAKDSLARMAPTPAVLNRQEGASQSGRARLVVQQAGMTELARSFGRVNDWDTRCYRQMWGRAQQFKRDPWWIRITDNPQAPEFLRVNEPVMGLVPQPQPVVDEMGQPVVDPSTGQPAMQMTMGIGVTEVRHRLAELDVDIIVATTPDTAALEQETFEALLELVRGGLDPFTPQFEILVEMSTISDKARILERLRTKREEIQQQQTQAAQVAQQAQAVELANTAAQASEREASANLKNAQAQSEQVSAMRDAFSPIAVNER